MRPPGGALLLAASYGAGLLTGLSHFPDPLSVGVAGVAGAIAVRRRSLLALVVALIAGMGAGHSARSRLPSQCAHLLPTSPARYRLQLVEPGVDVGRVIVLTPSCEGGMAARWPAGVALPAGAEANVVARWVPRLGLLNRPGGTLTIRDVVAVDSVGPGREESLRNAIQRIIADRFGERAPLVDALVTGRRGALDPAVREAFVGAGLIHLLAISGFHVGLLAGWVLLVLRLAGTPRHVAEIGAAALAMGYAVWLGGPAPATRAASLVLILAVGRWRQRQLRFDAVLGASALVVLVRSPWSVVDLGAWLSFAAVAGVGWALGWSDRAFGSATLIRAVAASIGATLATAPIAALMLGRVATVGIVLNLLAIPLVAAAMPAVLLAIVLDGVAPSLAGAFAASAAVLLEGLVRLAIAGAGWPGASELGPQGWSAALPWLAALAAAAWVTHRRTTAHEGCRRMAWCLALALWLPHGIAALQWRPSQVTDGLALHLLNVGQGDAAVLRTPGGRWVLVDAGPISGTYDAGERVVVPFLKQMGVRRIDLFVLSHAHRDHVGGAGAVAERFPVTLALDPGEPFVEAGYDRWLEAAAVGGTRWRVARAGDQWRLDGVEFRVLHPPRQWPHRGFDLNEDSIVLEVRYGAFVAWLTGDAGFPAESVLVAPTAPIALLKVGHHGSRHSTGEAFLAALAPRAAVISVGRNGYGHPAPATLARLGAARVPVWRTDRDGTVRVRTDGKSFTVSGGRTTRTFDLNQGDSRAASFDGHDP